MQSVRHIAARMQVLVEVVDHNFRAAKNDAVTEIVHVDQTRQRFNLRAAVHLEIRLLDLRRVLRHRVDLDPRRILRVTTDEVLDRARNRRREKQQLARRRHRLEDVLDVVTEAHVEHAVGLVENHDFELIQFHGAALHVVHHATGCPDHHLRARVERPKLPLIALAAIDRHAHHAPLEQRDLARLLRHLHREFARRAQNQHLHCADLRIHFLDRRNRKRDRLARPRRRLADDVATRHDRRNDRRLNRRSLLKSHLVDGFQDVGREAQFGEAEFFHAAPCATPPQKERQKRARPQTRADRAIRRPTTQPLRSSVFPRQPGASLPD